MRVHNITIVLPMKHEASQIFIKLMCCKLTDLITLVILNFLSKQNKNLYDKLGQKLPSFTPYYDKTRITVPNGQIPTNNKGLNY